MGIVEKIILTMIVYVLIFIMGLAAIISYLMINDALSLVFASLIYLLFYTLALIEEQ